MVSKQTFTIILIASLLGTLSAVGFYFGGLVAALKVACVCVLATTGIILWVNSGDNHE